MTALAQLQRDFSNYVLRDRAGIDAQVIGSETADIRQRIDIYRDGYRLRLIEVLGNDHPGLRHLAGDADFDALCRDYIDTHPSTHFNIRWFGAALPDFLRSRAPWSRQPALAQMAQLEWAMTLAFDAVDEPLATLADAAALTPEQWPAMRLRISTTLQRLRFCDNVGTIRRAIDREEKPPALETFETPREWAVWRRDRGVYQRPLEVDEAAVVDAARRGANFGELCGLLCEWHDDDRVALRAAGFLKLWIEQQWVAGLIVGDEAD